MMTTMLMATTRTLDLHLYLLPAARLPACGATSRLRRLRAGSRLLASRLRLSCCLRASRLSTKMN
eukprot:2887960-Pleurochrysis_carterae.AAC.1